jgi:hypothetical protein
MNILPSVAERGMLLQSTSICYVPLSGCAALHLACVSNARVTAVAGQLVYRAIRQCEEIRLYYSNDKRENKFLTGDCLRLKPVLSQPAPCISLLALILHFSPIFFLSHLLFLIYPLLIWPLYYHETSRRAHAHTVVFPYLSCFFLPLL